MKVVLVGAATDLTRRRPIRQKGTGSSRGSHGGRISIEADSMCPPEDHHDNDSPASLNAHVPQNHYSALIFSHARMGPPRQI
ncbi:hypothetical protein AVEN_261048-1 [Araneus ventricosus]|uniref:Uncharacterized protein n=2 Tax=Araneus ventricosus TaxID=182803 RepID=A0A4Y2G1Y7_ARAVE|nr:hypothetical protein AVEN_261048-1 [Araneus ventricosus]